VAAFYASTIREFPADARPDLVLLGRDELTAAARAGVLHDLAPMLADQRWFKADDYWPGVLPAVQLRGGARRPAAGRPSGRLSRDSGDRSADRIRGCSTAGPGRATVNSQAGRASGRQTELSTNLLAVPRGGQAIASQDAVARIRFQPDWQEILEGDLRPGGALEVEYAPERRRQLFGGRLAGRVVLHALFLPGGQEHSASLGPDSVRLAVPDDAAEVVVWFGAREHGGTEAWDSRFGQNYRFAVGRG
jgi:hypothetical protein